MRYKLLLMRKLERSCFAEGGRAGGDMDMDEEVGWAIQSLARDMHLH